MQVIDLLVKIANGEKVPKKVKVIDRTLLPKFQIIIWNEDKGLYEYCDGFEFDRILDKYHLNDCIEIIEDTPKEDKKYIEHIKMQENELHNHLNIIDKINEIIDKVNGK